MSAPKVRVGLYVEPEIARLLRIVAAERNTTVTQLVKGALVVWAKTTPEARRAHRRAK
jgi:hypothetical protein